MGVFLKLSAIRRFTGSLGVYKVKQALVCKASKPKFVFQCKLMQGTELAANVHMLVSKHSDSLEIDTGRLSHDKLVQHRRQHGTAASQIGERYGKESKSYLPWPTHSESFIYYSVCSLGLARENAMQQKFICLMHWCVGAVQLLLHAHSMHSLVINLFLMH